MAVRVSEVIKVMERLAPGASAEEWDRVGLQVGSPADTVEVIRVALELSEEHLALDQPTLFVVHHPLFFKPVVGIRLDQATGRLAAELIKKGAGLFAAHTNWDKAELGINQALAEKLGLAEIRVLEPEHREPMVKVVVYVPPEHVVAVREAMTAAGAGEIGHYSETSFATPGTGTFRPGPGTNPFTGEEGQFSEVSEYRLETIVPRVLLNRVVAATRQAHPYEEMAYDAIPLLNGRVGSGLGRVGNWPGGLSLAEAAQLVTERLGESVRVGGKMTSRVRRVAVVGGAGRSALRSAAGAADLLITGDVGHHDYLLARDLGLTVIDAGHRATEEPGMQILAGLLGSTFGERVKVEFRPGLSPYWPGSVGDPKPSGRS